MWFTVAMWVTLSMLIAGAAQAAEPDNRLVESRSGPPAQIDVNRPRTPFDCELPIGENWYGSRAKCLAYLCAGRNVYNEYVFEENRRRKNPCYGQNPTEFPGE